MPRLHSQRGGPVCRNQGEGGYTLLVGNKPALLSVAGTACPLHAPSKTRQHEPLALSNGPEAFGELAVLVYNEQLVLSMQTGTCVL